MARVAGEASAAGTRSVLHLPRVPWEGGSAYWSRFPEAHRAGWDRASFFPTVLWYGSCNPDQYVFDKAHGINTYAQCNPETTYDGLAAARVEQAVAWMFGLCASPLLTSPSGTEV